MISRIPGKPHLDRAGVLINNKRFEEWTDYSIGADIFNPSDGFSMRCGPMDKQLRELVLPGHAISIYIGDGTDENEHIILSGWTESYNDVKDKRAGTTIDITGRDLASDLVENTVPQGFNARGLTFLDMAQQICDPFGINVIVTNQANRLAIGNKNQYRRNMAQYNQDEATYNAAMSGLMKQLAAEMEGSSVARTPSGQPIYSVQEYQIVEREFQRRLAADGVPVPLRPTLVNGIYNSKSEAMPQDDESCWSFLMRYAARLEVHMWMTAQGVLVISRPRYNQDPSFLFINNTTDPTNNNVIQRRFSLDIAGIPTRINRTGRSIGKGEKRQRLQTFSESTVIFPSDEEAIIPEGTIRGNSDYIREKWGKDTEARNQDELDRRTYYAQKAAETSFNVIDLTVQGHDQDGVLYVPDTVARYVEEDLGIDGLYYIASCSYDLDSKRKDMEGQTTRVMLTPLNTWVPESA
jgi:prophage tail gpP-like protein